MHTQFFFLFVCKLDTDNHRIRFFIVLFSSLDSTTCIITKHVCPLAQPECTWHVGEGSTNARAIFIANVHSEEEILGFFKLLRDDLTFRTKWTN